MWSVYVAVLVLTLRVVYSQVRMCTLGQWEGVQQTFLGETDTSGTSVTEVSYSAVALFLHIHCQTISKVSYDYNNTRLATTTKGTKNGQQIAYKNIYNYKEKMLYTIEGETCQKFKLNTTFKKACVPVNSQWSWDVTWYGWTTRLFIFGFKGSIDGLHYYIQVTQYINPKPFMEQLYGEVDGVYVFKNSLFANITSGISDPSVFTPPSMCNNVDYDNQVWSDYPSTPGIFSI